MSGPVSILAADLENQTQFHNGFLSFNHPAGRNGLIPSIAYLRPDRTPLSVDIGITAIAENQNRVCKKLVYGNLRTLFKNDLIIPEGEPGWEYRFDHQLSLEVTDPVAVVRGFIGSCFESASGFDYAHAKSRGTILVGKPAFVNSSEETIYVERISKTFESLGFTLVPQLVYEPYAVMYFCRHVANFEFSPASKVRHTNVLIIDHGGGTLNTCIVQLDRKTGTFEAADTPLNSRCDLLGGSVLDEYLLRDKILASPLLTRQKEQLLRKLNFPRLQEVLLQFEEAKIKVVNDPVSRDKGVLVKFSLGIEGMQSIASIVTYSDVKDAFRKLWKRCAPIVGATLGTNRVKVIDYVVLSGGTCRLGLHKEFLLRDFRSYFDPGRTTFYDISDEDKPVAKGLCIQGALELAHKHSENLSNFLARDLRFLFFTDGYGEDRENLGSAVCFEAGEEKKKIWNEPHEFRFNLLRTPRRRFMFSIKDDNEERIEPIHIRHHYRNGLERAIKLEVQVTDAGECKPRFHLAPTRYPQYAEPDKLAFRIKVPDLAKRYEPTQQIYGFDFGTSTSALVQLDVDFAETQMAAKERFYDASVKVEVPPLEEYEFAGNELDERQVLTALRKVSPPHADRYGQFLMDFRTERGSYRGLAGELRGILETLLLKLAPDRALRVGEVQYRVGKTSYQHSQRARFLLQKRLGKEGKAQTSSILKMLDAVENATVDAYISSSKILHHDEEDELLKLKRIHEQVKTIIGVLLGSATGV